MRTFKWIVALAVLFSTAVAAENPRTDVVKAAMTGDMHAVHKLLEKDAKSALEATDQRGFTALHWSGIRAHWRIFAELLEAGADPNAIGGDGGTPLHWACHHDRTDLIGRLLDAGADLGIANQWGRQPLHVAARRNCLDVAALLLERGADPNATTREGWTALHVARLAGHEAMAEMLIEHGAKPELCDTDGHTAHDLQRQRPEAIPVEPGELVEYEGIYDLGHGYSIKIWRDGDHLSIREFAPDTLYAIAEDEFFCTREPWRVQFTRDHEGRVSAIDVDFLRRSVHGERDLSPRYVGSQLCLDCHSGETQGHAAVTWMRSRHGHAYWRLGSQWSLFLARLRPNYSDLEKPIEDERCLLCHVTGRHNDQALFAETFDPSEGVGCEACHGPGSEYMDPDIMADRTSFLAAGGQIPDESTCRHCHHKPDRFDWSESWPKIDHHRPKIDS